MELGPDFLTFVAVGFLAQLVDGALGMAFGMISSSFLIALGVPPSAASAGVHAVETVTTAVSGTSHAIARNIDWKLFGRIAIPGVIAALALLVKNRYAGGAPRTSMLGLGGAH